VIRAAPVSAMATVRLATLNMRVMRNSDCRPRHAGSSIVTAGGTEKFQASLAGENDFILAALKRESFLFFEVMSLP
jgi:hypothetical protein